MVSGEKAWVYTIANTPVRIIYKNWRGETTERSIQPIRIWFGSAEWHKEKQWLLRATDLDKNATRDFALKDIQKWIS